MKPTRRAYVLVLVLSSFAWTAASPCTIVTMSRDGRVLIGNNEDWTDPRSKVWFVPASEDGYGRVLFGFENRFIQGGINEHGLFYDANALPPVDWTQAPGKPLFEDTFERQTGDSILASCATVADVIAFFESYSVWLGGGKFVFADARGESITVEWSQGSDRITRRDGYYQISTNIPQWNIVPGEVDDPRFTIAQKVILSRGDVSLDTIRGVLAATHQEWSFPTMYSYICDLKSLVVHVYNFHNFEDAHVFDIRAELAKGAHDFNLPALFEVTPFASAQHEKNAPKLGVVEVEQKLAEGGVDAAMTWYRSVKDGQRDLPNYIFFDAVYQQLGKDLLSRGQARAALDVFTFACRAFPESADSWELQGDAWLAIGDSAQAKACYEHAVQLGSQSLFLSNKLMQSQK